MIVGHSMGSMVAQRFAIDNPDRVQGLILTGAFYARRNNPLLIEFWNQAISTLSEPVDPAFIAEFQRSTTADSLPTEFFTTVLAESGRLPAWLWRDLFRGFLVTDYTAEVGRIKAPTLLLWGDQDGFALQADQDSLKSRIAGTRLTTYPGIGHAANWEIPERFSADLVSSSMGSDWHGRTFPDRTVAVGFGSPSGVIHARPSSPCCLSPRPSWCVTATLAAAHDMFLKPAQFFLAENSTLDLELLNGTFSKSENSIERKRLQRHQRAGSRGPVPRRHLRVEGDG